MIDLLTMKKKRQRGVLDGQFLIAMPSLLDNSFSKTVIFLCAHSDEGAMGFIINRTQSLSFLSILQHLKLVGEDDHFDVPGQARAMPIYAGGPVENGRGFVLHSDDFMSESSIPVTEDICLTVTLDVVKAMARGRGPRKAAMMLGYAGWSAGQLENEMAQNTWLHCRGTDNLIFDPVVDDKYERAMATMGVSPAMLSTQAGHA
jgi:putative transcriptional regulator